MQFIPEITVSQWQNALNQEDVTTELLMGNIPVSTVAVGIYPQISCSCERRAYKIHNLNLHWQII